MSLIVVTEPKEKKADTAGDLKPGTWFIDNDGQILATVLDDCTNEKRVLCTGNLCTPFIANLPVRNFEVGKVLKPGTMLLITAFADQGETPKKGVRPFFSRAMPRLIMTATCGWG